jgi:protein-disulfide isomerase
MTDARISRSLVAGIAVAVGLTGAAIAEDTRKVGQEPAPKTYSVPADMPQDEFERRVHAYLLAHPEIIGEAIQALEARQQQTQQKEAGAILKSHADEIFRDAASPIGGNPLGNATLVEFFDYNCPYCRGMVQVIRDAESADPQLRIVYKEFPILGPGSEFAAKAALAANRQGKYLAFHEALMQAKSRVDESKTLEIASAIGLEVNRLKTDMQDPAIESAIKQNIGLAEALRISGTPGFVVKNQMFVGARDLRYLQSAIKQAGDTP